MVPQCVQCLVGWSTRLSKFIAVLSYVFVVTMMVGVKVVKNNWFLLVHGYLAPPAIPSKFQLTLGDYFKESPEVKKMAEEATDLLSWFLNHQPICSIFDDAQALQNNGKVLVYLIANLTHWMTHCTAFCWLLDLKTPIQHAIVLSHDDILAAQVGAKHNAGKCLKLTNTANTQCKVIKSAEFWNSLQMVVDDIEPICYGTNINQSNKTCPDQVLLTLASIFLHFDHHAVALLLQECRSGLRSGGKHWTSQCSFSPLF